MSERIAVSLGQRSYDILVGPGLLDSAGALIRPLTGSTTPVVTDETVAKLHLETLLEGLRRERIDARPIVLAAGESTKSWSGLERLTSALLSIGMERGAMLIAFGGGVIGDLAGFAAGILKRGVGFVQIPTTLLAQVDSSVGGKTAINVTEGKNLVGLFHQPKLVIADTKVLSTLPRRDLRAGYAEVVKYGALGDAAFFAWLEQNGPSVLAGENDAVVRAVAQSCRMKAAIVSQDEREDGERALLNLGHTFGHALEAATSYSDRLLHGEGVALGMVLAFALSAKLGFCNAADGERVTAHLKQQGLPTSLDQIPGERPTADAIVARMMHDKKAKGGKIAFVLARGIGRAFVAPDVPLGAVRDLLSA